MNGYILSDRYLPRITMIQAPNYATFCISWHNGFLDGSQGICTRLRYLKYSIFCDVLTRRTTQRRKMITTTTSIFVLVHDDGWNQYWPPRGSLNRGTVFGPMTR